MLENNYLQSHETSYFILLLENGLDINEKNIVGTTPLLCAVKKVKKEYISILLENGADANETDNLENNAFYYAVAEQSSFEMYDLLAAATTASSVSSSFIASAA